MNTFSQKLIKITFLCLLTLLIPFGTASAQTHSIHVSIEGGEYQLILGDTGQFMVPSSIEDEYGIVSEVSHAVYRSDAPEVVSVDENGVFTANTYGKAIISVELYKKDTAENNVFSYSDDNWYEEHYWYEEDYWYDDADQYENDSEGWICTVTYYFTVSPDLSNVTLKETSAVEYVTSEWDSVSFSFMLNSDTLLTDDGLDVSYSSSNEDIYVEGQLANNVITLYCYGIGRTTVTITINDVPFKVEIKTVLIRLSKQSLLLSPKETKNLKVKGIKKGITWSSTRKNVVTVTKNGKIKARKNGNAVIKARVGDKLVGCAVSVVSKQKKRAIKKAVKIGKTCKYSQTKRMQKGFYDCSSLVWKSYSKNGNNFGSSSYAPVAADLGKWCAKHKRLVKGGYSEKNISSMKIQAGDLVFKTGSDNGRYRGIYHVEMIAGYICYGFDSDKKPVLGMTWVNREDGYYVNFGEMVGRP